MITRTVSWVKTHKLTTLLLLVLAYFLFQSAKPMLSGRSTNLVSKTVDLPYAGGTESFAVSRTSAPSLGMPSPIYPQPDYAPNADVKSRLVIQNSYLSLLVTNVPDVRTKIINYAVSNGGYMVNSETNNPQDAPTATITVRVPSDKLDSALEMFRGLGVKVVSENLMGYDVTDQYVDIDARIATLEKTKAAMEAILERAVQISDLSNVTQQIISIQSQIDALKGSQKSLEENAKLAKLTIYLSTDELALPYAPSETWRPEVIAKLAIRGLITHLRALGTLAIWVVVYSVIWVPALIALYLINKRLNRKVS